LLLTAFRFTTQKYRWDRPETLLKRAITHTDYIKIPPGISTFSLGFAALSYVAQGESSYAYRLEGWDKDGSTQNPKL
jgi:hypothetical protein